MNKLNLILILSVLSFLSLGCLGPGSDADKCTGIIKSGSKEYIGKAKNENQAGLNACNKFCLDDNEFEAMYEIWLDSDKAKNLEEKRGKKVSKEDAIFEDKKLLDYVTKNCAVRCRAEANKGEHTLETKCRD